MWEIVKKFIALIMSFKDYFTQQKEKEIQKLKTEQAQAHKEIEDTYAKTKKALEEANYSSDAFESAMSELRDQQNS